MKRSYIVRQQGALTQAVIEAPCLGIRSTMRVCVMFMRAIVIIPLRKSKMSGAAICVRAS